MPMKVRELVRLLEKNGWKLVRQKGSHRHFKHPQNPNLLTIAGSENAELRPGTLNDILRKAGLK